MLVWKSALRISTRSRTPHRVKLTANSIPAGDTSFLQPVLLCPFSVSQILRDFFLFGYWLLFAGLIYSLEQNIQKFNRIICSTYTVFGDKREEIPAHPRFAGGCRFDTTSGRRSDQRSAAHIRILWKRRKNAAAARFVRARWFLWRQRRLSSGTNW